MPCFSPNKKFLSKLTSEYLKKYAVSGSFFELACGDGTFTALLAKKGFVGNSIDLSEEAINKTTDLLAGLGLQDKVNVSQTDLFNYKENNKYDLALAYDVFEHIENDLQALEKMKSLLKNNGFLFLSFPIKKKEWRWDDDVYGHLRRYDINEMYEKFSKNGLVLLEVIDYTFPIIWLMRRLYTYFKFSSKTAESPLSVIEKTKKSAFSSAAGNGVIMKCISFFPVWPLVFILQQLFKRRLWGCNVLLVIKKDADRSVS